MPVQDKREIPHNYTSADDEQVVRFLFGAPFWEALERLREKRVTGRSARVLNRFLGDLFLLRRNAYQYQELLDSSETRKSWFRDSSRDLEVVERSAGADPDVLYVLDRCRGAREALRAELDDASAWRSRVRGELGSVVGDDQVSFDPFSLTAHATDATDWRLYLPQAVVYPTQEKQVGPLLSAIGRLGLKAIPRGAGTGLTGGAVPVRPGCVMVNLEKLNRVRGIRPMTFQTERGPVEARALEAEAGVITEDAIQAAEKEGWVFATDPTSSWACTLGGNLAENAGGKTAVLWGTAIDNVLSFRLARPDGKSVTVKRVNHPLRKIRFDDTVEFIVEDSLGKEISRIALKGDEIRRKGLWKDITNKALGGVPGLQKEGCDGVITSAEFVLHKPYPLLATACLEFYGKDFDEASRVILSLSREFENKGAETLQSLEHFDEEYVRAIDYRAKSARGEKPKAVLLLDLVAPDGPALKAGQQRLENLVERHPGTDLFFAQGPAEGARFWADRKRLGAIARRTNAFKLNEDVVLPLESLSEYARWIESINLEEERFNLSKVVETLRERLREDGDDEDAAALAAKRPAAQKRLDHALAEIEKTSRSALREGRLLEELLRDLEELYRGHEGLGAELRKLATGVRGQLLVTATHMHAGDGNVHVNIPVLSNDRWMMRRASALADTAMRKAVKLGGSVSGEHGIGVTKFKHLDASRRAAMEDYRRQADPTGLMNPGKLCDSEAAEAVFTPSFNLLELEARILQHESLFELLDKIARCVRCGKCKPDCCVFHPEGGLFYHPRNKNLALGAVIEALLCDAQRSRSVRFKFLKDLADIADHCTLCHKCLKPCPVDIDTGEITLLERRILAARHVIKKPPAVRLALAFLVSRSRWTTKTFRFVVLGAGGVLQRWASRTMAWVPGLWNRPRRAPIGYLKSPLPKPHRGILSDCFPKQAGHQAVFLKPPGEAVKTVFYFPGCGSERQFSDVGRAALYLLLKTGHQVVLPPPNLCCGFPVKANADSRHGRMALANTILFSQIREMFRFLEFDAVALTCGTCREALLEMSSEQIFAAPLRDVWALAIEAGLKMETQGVALYHKPCHDSLQNRVDTLASMAGLKLRAVPHCCSEAGTLALSRPDITGAMLDKKSQALREAIAETGARKILTNCPSCLQGLGRQEALGVQPTHLVVELAERTGGAEWKKELTELLKNAELVNI